MVWLWIAPAWATDVTVRLVDDQDGLPVSRVPVRVDDGAVVRSDDVLGAVVLSLAPGSHHLVVCDSCVWPFLPSQRTLEVSSEPLVVDHVVPLAHVDGAGPFLPRGDPALWPPPAPRDFGPRTDEGPCAARVEVGPAPSFPEGTPSVAVRRGNGQLAMLWNQGAGLDGHLLDADTGRAIPIEGEGPPLVSMWLAVDAGADGLYLAGRTPSGIGAYRLGAASSAFVAVPLTRTGPGAEIAARPDGIYGLDDHLYGWGLDAAGSRGWDRGARWDQARGRWRAVSGRGAPVVREGALVVPLAHGLWVWGGAGEGEPSKTSAQGAIFEATAGRWREIESEGAPRWEPQLATHAVGDRVLVWPRQRAEGPHPFHLYDAIADRWTSLTADLPTHPFEVQASGSVLAFVGSDGGTWIDLASGSARPLPPLPEDFLAWSSDGPDPLPIGAIAWQGDAIALIDPATSTWCARPVLPGPVGNPAFGLTGTFVAGASTPNGFTLWGPREPFDDGARVRGPWPGPVTARRERLTVRW